MMFRTLRTLAGGLLVAMLCAIQPALAHHILGRPSYGLDADTTETSSIELDSEIGDYNATFMLYPSLPEPGDHGRINLFIAHVPGAADPDGPIAFSIRRDGWLASIGIRRGEREIGRQVPDDRVYRQAMTIPEEGHYVIVADFRAGGKPYQFSFPVQIGEPPVAGPAEIGAVAVVLALLVSSVAMRRRVMTGKLRSNHG